ncbi:hypothetical protein [Hallella absiana]|uniref:hypothetical protein n=1 Tax=Hallella absiana TaxID=2925336 RepID=UPI0021C86F47|nr:hypothetical protein [Hallella absiana]
MDNNTFNENIGEWLKKLKAGDAYGAKEYYYQNLFDAVLEQFSEREAGTIDEPVDILFSVLGYSPEPIVMAAKLLNPKHHIIIQDEQVSQNRENARIIAKYLPGTKTVTLHNETFACIYDTLKEQMALYPGRNYTINITGGKKSMAASAGIFARDFNCNLVYIDYDSYDPDTRRPLPGSERLNIVYSPKRDMPELFHS